MKLIADNHTVSPRKNVLMYLLGTLGFNKISQFQEANQLVVDGLFGINSYNALYKKLLKVQDINFEGSYFRQSNTPKRQIAIHHSAGWDDARLMFDIWKRDRQHHVATAIGITDDGDIIRGYDEAFWAYHIGARNTWLEQISVGVEICNWGCLQEREGKIYTYVNDFGKRGRAVTLEPSKTIELNYKGFKYYEVYTDAEIESLRLWILLNALRFDIPMAYSEKDMWSVSSKALNGVAGIYTHNSYISWKSDASPQPKLIAMLKELANYEK